MKKIFLFIGFGLCTLSACYYNNETEFESCDANSFKYSTDIKPILDRACNSCHSTAANFGAVILDNYTEVKKYADRGNLLGSIKHETQYSPMPKGSAKLSDCEIQKFSNWIAAGAPNN